MKKEKFKQILSIGLGELVQVVILPSMFFIAANSHGQITPLETVKKVAEKVMNESSFTYFPYIQSESAAIQTIDFRNNSEDPNAVAYALSYLTTAQEKEILIGISSGSPVKMWLNDNLIYINPNAGNKEFKEIAYGIYVFADTFRVTLDQKINRLLMKVITDENSKINMAAILDDGFIDKDISFSLEPLVNKKIDEKWIFTEPFENDYPKTNLLDQSFPPESEFNLHYSQNGKPYTWRFKEKHLLLDIEIPTNASFVGHPYTEWHYSTGATMWSILRLSEATSEEKYKEFVKKFCEFTLGDYSLFENQYFRLNEYNGHNSRIFRMNMLDDASGPALPFISLYEKGELDKAWFLIEKAAKYASMNQFRLEDKTLCRPEPSRWTIWGDDLFMYVPFILKYSKLTNNKALQEDAIHQARMFYKYLFDKDKGLYYHGWFSETSKHSVANWSRANGWIAWAMSELLLDFPGDNKQYRELLKIHKEHLNGLLKYQHESGLFHQVLDRPDTYLETSGTAMFVIAIARGINNGLLGEKYKTATMKAWEGIQARIEPDGTVLGITQGTGIGTTVDFYQKRSTPLHDPRGVGAVITAGIEVQKLLDNDSGL